MTNYDRILEEGNPKILAKLLNDHPCPPNYGAEECNAAERKYNKTECESCWLDYLNQEVEE